MTTSLTKFYTVWAIVWVGTFSSGCSVPSETYPAPTAWRGAQPHFEVYGFINGTPIEVVIAGDDAQSPEVLRSVREYVVPDVQESDTWTDGYLSSVEIEAKFLVDGELIHFEVEVLNHDLQKNVPGATIEVVPRDDLAPPRPTEMSLELELETAEGEKFYEQSAQTGTFVLNAYSGRPGPDGVVIPEGEGVIGGYFQARWSVAEELTGSFTAPCSKVRLAH